MTPSGDADRGLSLDDAAVWGCRLLLGREPAGPQETARLVACGSVGRMRDWLLAQRQPGQGGWEQPPSLDSGRWSYRLILGREPESEAVVAGLASLPSVAEGVDGMLASEEFRAIPPPMSPPVPPTWQEVPTRRGPVRVTGLAGDSYFANVGQAAAENNWLGALAEAVAAARGGPIDVVDVGANLGLATLAMAPHARRIVAVEPNDQIAALHAVNMQMNGAGHVTLDGRALSDAPGVVAFRRHDFAAGSHIVGRGAVPTTGDVTVTTLDALVEAHGLADLGLVKIDAEGFDPKVVAGGGAVFERHRPLVALEFNSWAMMAFSDTYPRAFLEALIDRFPMVWSVYGDQREPGSLAFRQLRQETVPEFLYTNMLHHGCVDDVICGHDDAWLDAFRRLNP